MKSVGAKGTRTWKNPILWHTVQLHLRRRTLGVLLEELNSEVRVEPLRTAGGRERETMYFVNPQWQEPLYSRRVDWEVVADIGVVVSRGCDCAWLI